MYSFMLHVINENDVNYSRIEKAIQYLEENFQRQPELDEVVQRIRQDDGHRQEFRRHVWRPDRVRRRHRTQHGVSDGYPAVRTAQQRDDQHVND